MNQFVRPIPSRQQLLDSVHIMMEMLDCANTIQQLLSSLESPGVLLPYARHLKIQTCIRGRHGADPPEPFPRLTISGRWLEETGFHCNGQVGVLPVNGILIIYPLK